MYFVCIYQPITQPTAIRRVNGGPTAQWPAEPRHHPGVIPDFLTDASQASRSVGSLASISISMSCVYQYLYQSISCILIIQAEYGRAMLPYFSTSQWIVLVTNPNRRIPVLLSLFSQISSVSSVVR